ncbi:Carboxylate-amine ligase YbdK [Corynebacterium occultum]|uniref:Carboxylate-amine ligase YbdK n=2 Tax=Corynebacterium occultum TaxID=2675219 RepID=A0A6B8VUE6_9CORY|nr:Carboxylate-amine ligase YbdK [Corynebacterium occultum]
MCFAQGMGDAISSENYTPQQRTRYRAHLGQDLEIFDRHLQRAEFEDRSSIGLELELNLVDENFQPAPLNRQVLANLGEEYQSELGSYNVELNHPPLSLAGAGLRELHQGVEKRLAEVREAAEKVGAQVAMIGTLPTLDTDFLESPEWMTPENRYRALNNTIMNARGELVRVDLADREHLVHNFASIATESACTSMQLHLQLAPNKFAAAWNASQAIAGAQVALSGNSPLFLGWKLWQESRIPVFRQSIDTRTPELVAQGVRPRVWFGERWITSIFDLFEENVRYFSPLLPEPREFSGTPVMQGKNPGLHYLNLHNGTVWRWNRPIYAPGKDLSHLRVENRILPAGPSVTDLIADAAFYYGLVKYLAEATRPVWSRLTFEDAERNFFAGARNGLHARMQWPTQGQVDVTDLIEDTLIPMAREGLRALEVDEDLIDTYLEVIEGRAETRQNGATWQLRTLDLLEPHGTRPESPERKAALAEMLRLYIRHQASGEPVHTWEVGA